MNRLHNRLPLIVLCMLASIGHANTFPLPSNTIVSAVSKSAQTMGMNLSIQKFESRLSVPKLIAYYQKLWGKNGIQSEMPKWQMIGAKVKGQYYNVQVQASASGSQGYLSISDLPERINNPLSLVDFPKMGGSEVIDNQKHKDLLNTSRTILIRNKFSVSANSQYYINHYRQRGWALQNDTRNSGLKGRVLFLEKGKNKLSLTINSLAGESNIVANLSRAN